MLKVKDKDMSSDEDLRNLGNGIEALIEEVDKLKGAYEGYNKGRHKL